MHAGFRWSAAGSIVCAAAVAAHAAAPRAAQTPVFRTDTQYVSVNVVVTDGRDQIVTGLSKDDFEIVSNGRPQTIADFEWVHIPAGDAPIDLDAPTLPPADVASNALSAASSRAFVFLIDDQSIPPSELVPLKRALTAALRALAPGDQVAIVWASRSDLSQDFTSDTNRLVDAVNQRRAAIGLDLPMAGRNRMFQMRNVVRSLASSHHARRAVFLVGTSGCLPTPPNPDWKDCMDLVTEAQRADVPFYAFDPRLFVDAGATSTSVESPDGRTDAARASLAARTSAQTLASLTGGRSMMGAGDPAAAARALVLENGSYYLLGFSPQPAETDGRFHELTVRVKRPGLIVRARRGYMAPSPAPAKPMTATREMTGDLAAGLDDPRLPLRVFAAPLGEAPRDSKGKTRTLVTMELAYPIDRDVRTLADDLRIGILALTPDGKIKSSFQRPVKITGTWLPDAGGRLVVNEIVDLADEPLTLRVGVTSRALNRTGTAHLKVVPPDFSKGHLQMGGLVVGFARESARLPLADAAMGLDSLRGIVPFQPTTVRTFAPADTLRLFARVTWDRRVPSARVRVRLGGVGFRPDLVTDVAGVEDRGRWHGALDVPLPLDGAAPGAYVVAVDVTVGADTVTRFVPIAIR